MPRFQRCQHQEASCRAAPAAVEGCCRGLLPILVCPGALAPSRPSDIQEKVQSS